MSRNVALAVTVATAFLTPAKMVFAWGATGHEYISGVAAESLPDELPAFVRTPEAIADIAVFGRELDRSKNSGLTHDSERDPGHRVAVDDQGRIAGVLPLASLPPTREAYDTALRAAGSTQYRTGYLPLAIIDGWQQLAKDFAYWRADVTGARSAATAADRAWFEEDRKRRERLTIRDLGVWTHYVGDASQPMHVSVHYDGWGPFPNPAGYTTSRGFHSQFEGAFVRANVTREMVKKLVASYRPCPCSIEDRMRAELLESLGQVIPLYELEKTGAFTDGNGAGTAFAAARLAAGATAARDMIIDAWRASADMVVGYPNIKVRDIESGRHILTREDFDND